MIANLLQRALKMLCLIVLMAGNTLAQDFPVKITHALGDTIVEARPQRIVSLGYNDHDFLYALGIAPVAVVEWWGNQPYATWPWAEEARKTAGAAPVVSKGTAINFEWVLAQNPDLIIATYRDLDKATYDKLGRIAPVIARPAGYPVWQAPWQSQLRLIDQATSGHTLKSAGIIADIDAMFAILRQNYPQFQGKSASMADLRGGQFVLWSPDTAPGRFLAQLGFILPQEMVRLSDPAGWITLSLEQAELIDLDVIVWPNARQEMIEAIPIYRDLRLFRQQRSIWTGEEDATLSAALWFYTPLSLKYAAARLAGKLADTLQH